MPTPATTPTYFDPVNWPTFSLRAAGGGLLASLPPTLALTSPLGTPDPNTWDRPPDTTAWFARGDGLPQTRPTLTLEGQTDRHWHRTRLEALALMNTIGAALPLARELWWVDQLYAELDGVYPGSYLPSFGSNVLTVTHRLTLNVRGTLIPGSAGIPLPGGTTPPPDTGYY